MHGLATWLRFVGAWLVVVGAVYQASLELGAEEDAVDRMRALREGAPPPPPKVSARWWLLPPVRIELERRRHIRAREAVVNSMSSDDFEVLTRYFNKAIGWLVVGLGATCIAAAETEALVDELHGGVAIFVTVVVAMAAIAIGHAAARHRRSTDSIARRRT